MQIKICEAVARWLKSDYGVARYLERIQTEEGDPKPSMPKIITNAYTDKHLQNMREVNPIFPQVIVDITQPIRVAGDGPGNYRRATAVDLEIVVLSKSSDPALANWQIQHILEAVDLSMQELIYARETPNAVAARLYGGIRIDAMTEVEYGATGDSGIDGVQAGMFTGVLSVSHIKSGQ